MIDPIHDNLMVGPSGLPYRPCAGVLLINDQGLVFAGQRIDQGGGEPGGAWQMPQGGIDKGEDAEEAAFRELGEETGVHGGLVEIIARSREEYFYDLPDHLIGKMWGGKYRGQRQHWYLLRFTGRDSDVDIEQPHPEFNAWRWSAMDELPELIVPFKRPLYEALVAEFGPLAAASTSASR